MSDSQPFCPISREPAKVIPWTNYSLVHTYECDRCGEFAMSRLTSAQISPDDSNRSKISACLRERTIHGQELLLVSMDKPRDNERVPSLPFITWKDLLDSFPKTVGERLDRALLNVARLLPVPGQSVVPNSLFNPVLFAEDDGVAAWVLQALQRKGWLIEYGGPRVALSVDGWNRVTELQREPGRMTSLQAFVAMRLTNGWESIYGGIRGAIEASGYNPLVIVKKEYLGKIDDQIVAEIRRSKFLVADFSGHRQSVYYEAGFAMGLGMPVIWTCKKEDLKDAHFDTRQYNHIDWETPEELSQKLERRIRATIH